MIVPKVVWLIQSKIYTNAFSVVEDIYQKSIFTLKASFCFPYLCQQARDEEVGLRTLGYLHIYFKSMYMYVYALLMLKCVFFPFLLVFCMGVEF